MREAGERARWKSDDRDGQDLRHCRRALSEAQAGQKLVMQEEQRQVKEERNSVKEEGAAVVAAVAALPRSSHRDRRYATSN